MTSISPKKLKGVAAGGAAAICVGVAISAAGHGMFEILVHRKRGKLSTENFWARMSKVRINHPREQFPEAYEEGKAWCYAQKMKDWYIRSEDGLILHASFLEAKDAKRIILLSHGYKGNTFSEFAGIARYLYENGCSLLFIDQRCCGLSEGEFITFGAKEKGDVRLWCQKIARKNKEKIPVYLYGMSMGAATVLMASGEELPPEVKGVIADCGFRSMKSQIRDLSMRWFYLPRIELLLLRMSLRCRVRGNFRMKDADTAAAMAEGKLPCLFFHGEEDTYVYPKNSIEIYKHCRAPKELVLIPGAKHLCSPYADPALYRGKLMGFFERCEELL